MDGWRDGWMERWMDGEMDGWRDGWMERWMDGEMDGWMERWMDGKMDRWRDGWMNRWMDGWKKRHTQHILFMIIQVKVHISMGPPRWIDPMTHRTMSERSTMEQHLTPYIGGYKDVVKNLNRMNR